MSMKEELKDFMQTIEEAHARAERLGLEAHSVHAGYSEGTVTVDPSLGDVLITERLQDGTSETIVSFRSDGTVDYMVVSCPDFSGEWSMRLNLRRNVTNCLSEDLCRHLSSFEDGDEAREELGRALGVELPGPGLNLRSAFIRNRWRGYSEAFYRFLDRIEASLSLADTTEFKRSTLDSFLFNKVQALDVLDSLPRDGSDTVAGKLLVERALPRGPLSRCKSVRRALATHPEIAMALPLFPAFCELVDPNVVCAFINHPDALLALAALNVIEDDGWVLRGLVGVYGEKAALSALLDRGVQGELGRWYRLDVSRTRDLRGTLGRLKRGGLNARRALAALPVASARSFAYSPCARRLAGRMNGYEFRLPRTRAEFVLLGEAMHNCLKCYAEDCRGNVVVYVTRVGSDKPLAAFEVDVENRKLIQAYAPFNERIDDPKLAAAVKKTFHRLWTADPSLVGEIPPSDPCEADAPDRDFEELLAMMELEVPDQLAA